MTLPIVAIRPEPGCSATVAAGRARGLAITPHPLFAVEAVAWDAPDPDTVDAVLAGSANAFRHGGAALAAFAGKPVHAVGESTAAAARTAGFAVAAQGSGGLQQVLDRVPSGTRLLRLAGEEHVSLAPPPRITITTRIVYASRPVAMPLALAEMLAGGALVLLHSAAAASHFAEQCDRLNVPRGQISIAALGLRIAAAAGEGWAALRSAAAPSDDALLALTVEMCH